MFLLFCEPCLLLQLVIVGLSLRNGAAKPSGVSIGAEELRTTCKESDHISIGELLRYVPAVSL